MRAYRVVAWEQPPQLVDVAKPVAGPGQVVVRVAGVGLCHSDLMMSTMPGELAESLGWSVPFTLGHETAGWIEELGDGVEGFAIGDAVALVSPHSCGVCEWCARGLDRACVEAGAGRGYGRDGGLADSVLVDSARSLLPLGDFDPVHAGPLTDAGATSYHAVGRALPKLAREGATAVVVGAGGLGSFAVQFLRAVAPSARVIAVDTNPARLEYARELGAHETVDSLRGLSGADAVLDFVGVDDTITRGIRAVGPMGSYVLVGAEGGQLRAPVYHALAPREIDVTSFQGSTLADAHAVVALAREGKVRSEVDEFPLSRVAEAYEALDAGTLHGRAVVVPD